MYCQSTVEESIIHDGIQRDYTLYFPASYEQNSEDYALIFNFHGFTSNGAQQRLYSRMDLVSDTAQVVMCYPEGIDAAWNVGWNFGSMEDDVGFTAAMIDKFVAEHRINSKKVYACGMSNGGFFSYKLACELNDKIAAVASVTGSLVPGQDAACNPGRAVPVLEIHGTADAVVPYEGSTGVAMPIEDVVQFWVDKNACDDDPDIIDIPNTSLTDESTASIFRYNTCESDTEVQFIKIENGGHTWPDALLDIGVTNRDFNASQYIWEFFSQFTLPTVSSTQEEDLDVFSKIQLYPNPSSGSINISHLPINSTIELYRVDGSFINRRLSTSTTEAFDLERGVYIISVGNQKTKTQFFTIIE